MASAPAAPQECQNFIPMFQKFGSKLKVFKTNSKSVHLDFLSTILKEIPNVETISFCNEGVQPGTANYEAIKMPNLKTIQFEIQSSGGLPQFMQFFVEITSLETVSIASYIVYIKDYLPLLKQQKNLKKLALSGKYCREIVKDLCENSYFSLKSFNFMNYSQMETEDIRALAKFLEKQADIDDLLLYLHLLVNMDPVMEAILKMPKLNHLYLELIDLNEETPLEFNGINYNVKSMVLGVDNGCALQKLIDTFPGLEKMEITLRKASNANIQDLTIERLLKLETLKISMNIGTISLLRNFTLCGKLHELILFEVAGPNEDWSVLFSQNQNIQSIEMIGCQITDEIIDGVAKYLTKLKKFVCFDSLGLKGMTALLENCISLKRIVVGLSGSEKVYADLFQKYAERLEGIEFKRQYRLRFSR